MNRLVVFAVLLGCPALGALVGCGGDQANSALIAQLRPNLVLEEEPDGVMQISELRESFLGAESPDDELDEQTDAAAEEPEQDVPATDSNTGPREVVVMGIVGGMSNPFSESRPDFPFADNQALFFVADAAVVAEIAADEHHHAPGEECAFCAAHAEDHSKMLAVVQFRDEKGKVLPVDARDLFDLKEGETVVVQGAASMGAGETMIVDATGLYIRR